MGKKDTDPAEFWKDYEAQTGETVLSYCLGRYLRGWDAYQEPLWVLNIVLSGSYRFHHFPHEGWIEALARVTRGGKGHEEKIIVIPREKIYAAAFVREPKLLKRILFSTRPWLSLKYRRDDGSEAELIVESEGKAKELALILAPNDA